MAKGYEINVHSDSGVVKSHALTTDNGPMTISAQSDVRYELLDPATGVAPQQVLFKRDGDNLELHFGDAAENASADLIVEGYYALSTAPKFFGLAEDGDFYFFVPQTGRTEDLLEKLDDDDETYQSLGYEDTDTAIMWWPLVLGGAALAAVALSSDSDDDDSVIIPPGGDDTDAPVVTFDNLITNDTTPQLTGTVDDPDAQVIVIINGVEYEATNNGDGTWTLADDVVAELEEGTTTVTVIATDAAGNEGNAEGEITIDTTAPGVGENDTNSIAFNDGGDGMLSADEVSNVSFSGQIEPGASIISVVVSNGDIDVIIDPADITVDANGQVTISGQDLSELADGEWTVTMTVEDAAGNQGTVSDTTMMDTAAPSVTIDDAITNDSTPALTGTVDDPDATVVVTVNGVDYPATNNGDGTWTLADNTLPELAEGSYDISVTATDNAGNTVTDNGTLTIDTTAPNAPTIDAGNGTEITGTAEPGSEVNIDVDGDGTPDYTTTTDGDGNWSVTPDTPLADGTEVTATATDPAGNVSDPASDIVNADAPTVTMDDAVTNDTTPALTGTIDDPDATIVVNVNGVDYPATNHGDGTWTLADNTLPELVEGNYSVTVTATDAAGNTGSATGNLVIDTTAPNAPTVEAGNGTEITGTAEPGSEINVDIDGDGTPDHTTTTDDNGNWSVTPDTPLEDGTEVTATATDPAGNVSDPASDIVNADAPTVTMDDAITNDSTPALTGTIDDPDATVVVTVNGIDYTATNNGDGTWTLADNTLPELADDTYSVTVTATDTANNSSTTTGSLVIDTVAPNAPTVDAGNGTEITGTAEPGSEINVDIDGDGTPDHTTTTDDNGNWSVTPDTPLEDGTEVTATATDPAGNVSEPGTAIVDGTAPVVTFDEATTNDTTPALSGTIDDPDATIVVNVNGVDYPATNHGDGTWTLADNTLPELAEGSYNVTVTATDAAGNTGTATGNLVIDTTAPATGDGTHTIAFDDGGDEWLNADEATNVTLSGVIEADATVDSITISDGVNTITVDAADITIDNGNVSVAGQDLSGLQDGELTVTMTVTDSAGNTGTVTDTTQLDATAPAAPVINTGNGSEITGTAEPGSTINVDVDGDGTPDYTTTTDGDGNWSVTPTTPIADGTEISATATDPAGNESTPGTSIVNAQAPTVTMDDAITNDSTPALTGTVDDPDATIVVNVNGVDYPATNHGDGTWTLADNTLPELADDTYSVTVTATDTANNSSTTTGSLVIDTVAPNAPTVDAGNGTEITGTAEPGSEINVDIDGDGTPDHTTTTDDNGNWSVTPDTPLEDGTEVTATATDPAGNVSEPGTAIVDGTAPTVTFDEATTNDTTPALSGTIDDPDATIVVNVNGVDYPATNHGDGTWTLADNTLPELAEGNYSVTVTATDAAGNTGSATGNLVIDTTAPANGDGTHTIAFDDGGDEWLNADEATNVTLSGVIEADASVDSITISDGVNTVTVNAADITIENGNVTVAGQDLSGLQDGELTVTMTVTDSAGNTGTVTDTTQLDATAPAAPVINTGNGSEITGTAEPGSTINVDVDGDGTPDYTTTTDGDGNWSVTPTSPIADGTEVTATATDPAGNVSAPASDIVDGTAPVVTFDEATTNDTTPALSGTIDDPDASIVVNVNGVDYPATNHGDGTWTLADNTLPELAEGNYSVTVTATDAAGNTGTATGNLVIDTTAPATGDGTHTIAFDDGGDEWLNADEATNVTLSGVIEADASVDSITISDGVNTVTVNAADITIENGNVTVAGQDLSGLQDGELTVTMTVTDSAGNTGTVTDTTQLDATAPAAPVINTGNGTEITGTAEPGSEVNVDVDGDGTPDYTTTTDDNGNWSVTPDTPLTDGTEVTATATDPAGNVSDPASDIVNADAPTITMDDAITNDSTPALTGTIDDPDATVVVTVNGNDYTATNHGDGTWTLSDNTLPELADDTYSVTVTATDTANNSSTATGSLVIDTMAPDAPTVDAGNGTEITGTAEPGSEINVDVDGDGTPDYTTTTDGDGNWSVTPTTPLEDGTEVTATATDPAGNVSDPASDLVDGTAPTVTMDDAVTNDTTPALTGTIDDPDATVVVNVNGVDYPATNHGDGTWSLADNTLPELAEGNYNVTVTATDAAGNTGTATGNLVIDTSIDGNGNGQTVTFDSITNDSGTDGDFITSDTTLIFNGTIDLADETTLTVSIGGNDYTLGTSPELTVDTEGNWSLDLSGTALPAGTYPVIATVTDAAGNSQSTTSQNVVIQAIDAVNDAASLDMGEPVVTVNPAQTTDNVQVLGLAENTGGVDASASFTVAPDNLGNVQIEVGQTSLAAVADAYIVEVYDENGELVYQGVSANSQLADVGGLDIFNTTGDETISISIPGLAAGNYSVVVRNDESKLQELLDGDGNGDISLTELGNAGVVLGPDNQAVVLDTVETTLNDAILGIPIINVGTAVRTVLEGLLDTTTTIGAGELVNLLTGPLDALGLTSVLDTVLGVVADALLSNTLSLLQGTEITTTVTEYSYSGETIAQGNLIEGDAGGAGADAIVAGAQITVITNAAGESVNVPATGTVTIQGAHGVLEIAADGSYTYTANGDRSSIGQDEVFNYTLSDGENSDSASLTITIAGGDLPPVQAQNDSIDMNLGAQTSVVNTPVTDSDMQVLGLLEGAPSSGSGIAGTPLSVGPGYFGEVVVEVSQNALVAVADAYIVEVIDANGNVVATAMSPDNPLVGDVAGLNLLGVTGDDTLVAKFSGLPEGNYTVVVRNDESVLESLFDADGTGSISLTELGQGGVVLGEENQDVVLTAVENALNGSNSSVLNALGLGSVVRFILEPVLNTVDALGVGDLVGTLTKGLNALGLTSLLDTVLDAVADALLSNTLTLLQQTDVTTTLTEYAFEGSTSASGNVIQGASNGDGSDSIAQGGVVTQVTHSNGETVTVLGSGAEGVTIKGNYGDLTIFEDGSYTYVANGVRDGLGDSDSFSYTISDGSSSSTANLNFNLTGQGVSGNTARAEVSYDFASEAGASVTDAVEYTWILGLLGAAIPVVTNTESDKITVAANTMQDLTLTVDGGDLLSLGSGLDLAVEKFVDGTWQVVETFSSDQLIGLLGLGGNGEFTVYGLTEGEYRVSMDVDTGVVSLVGGVSVDLSSTIHHLDQFVVDGVKTASGSLLENDVLFDPAYSLTVSTDGTSFQDPTGGITLAGQYGTLHIDEAGNYTYTPDSNLAAFGGTLTDTFSYRVEYPNGTIEEAEFNVFVTAAGEGLPAATAATLSSDLLFSMVDGGELMLQEEIVDANQPSIIGKDEEMMRQAVLEHTFEDDLALLLNDVDEEAETAALPVTGGSGSISIDGIMFNDASIMQQSPWTDEDGNVGF